MCDAPPPYQFSYVWSVLCTDSPNRWCSFSIDLDKPFADVVDVVNEVACTASIKGTFEYGDQEQLDGAQFQEKSQLFPPWSEPGKVFVQGSYQSLSHIAGPIFVSDL